MSTLEQELNLLGQALKRKRSPSDGNQGRIPLPKPFSGAAKRRDSVAGSSLEHPIELDDDSADADTGTLNTSNLPHEIIVIEDSDEDVGTRTLPSRTGRGRRRDRARKRGQSPERKRVRKPTPKRAPEHKMFPVLVTDDPEFLRAKALVENVTRYTFKRVELVREALYPIKHLPVIIDGRLIRNGNYRLAILGDTVLKTALLDSRFQEEETLQETHLGAQNLMTNRTLALLAEHHGLDNLLMPYFSTIRPSIHVLGTLIEAIIGAVWNDSDKDLAVVKRLLEALYGINLD